MTKCATPSLAAIKENLIRQSVEGSRHVFRTTRGADPSASRLWQRRSGEGGKLDSPLRTKTAVTAKKSLPGCCEIEIARLGSLSLIGPVEGDGGGLFASRGPPSRQQGPDLELKEHATPNLFLPLFLPSFRRVTCCTDVKSPLSEFPCSIRSHAASNPRYDLVRGAPSPVKKST